MKKFILLFVWVLCFSACENDNEKNDPTRSKKKERVDVLLTKAEEEVLYSNNDFAYNLYGKIHDLEKSGTNIFISPLGVSLAFSMLNNGAAGETQQQIQQVLGFEDLDAEAINSFYQKMLAAAIEIDPQVTLESANSIWLKNGFPILQPFIDVNKHYFDAEIKNVDFTSSETLKMINQWASDKTHGKVENFLTELSPATVVFLMNALYFWGEWADEFEKSETREALFTNANGTVSSLPMMNKTFYINYQEYPDYATAELPYGNGAFYMTIVLPNQGVSLNQVAGQIQASDKADTYRQLVRFKVPRFKAEYEVRLIEILKQMGMTAAFDAEEADFSNMSTIPTFISMVKQKAFVNVNEKGTEAAAATGIGMDLAAGPDPSQPVDFFVDRPFVFTIREVSTGTIYFMGEINNL